MTYCPCDSQKSYVDCCEPYLTAKHTPETPEALMRSRYTAYTMANIAYIKQTMRGKAAVNFHEIDAERWAKKVLWIKLHVVNAILENDGIGFVEFEAFFVEGSCLKSIHENSRFIREQGRWYYVDGTHLPVSHATQIVSLNMNCPCGRQRKFKNCHGKA